MTASDHQINRRAVLMGGGLAGVGALATLISGCGAAATDTTAPSVGLEGAWRVEVTLDDGRHHQVLMLCTREGGVGVTAALSANSLGTGFGAWGVSANQSLLTLEALVFTSGVLDFELRIRAMPAIDQSGDHMTAQAKFDVRQAGATTFTGGGGATWTGTRIKPLPI